MFAILLSEPKPRGFGLSDYEVMKLLSPLPRGHIVVILSPESRHSQAGLYYGIVGSLTTLYGLIVGPMIDMLGCRNSILLGGALSLVARVAIAFTTTTWVLWINAFVIMVASPCHPFVIIVVLPVMREGIHATSPSRPGNLMSKQICPSTIG